MTYGLKPLSSGDVVNLTLQVWRTKFNQFWKIGWIASLWSILTTLGFLVIYLALMSGILASLPPGSRNDILDPLSTSPILGLLIQIPARILGLAVLLVLPLMCFATAKTASLGAVIARLTFNELNQTPESPQQVRSEIGSRIWSFFGISITIGLMMMGLYLGLCILALVILFVYTVVAVGVLRIVEGSAAAFLLGLLYIVGLILLIAVIVLLPLAWFYSRWLIAEVPLAIEPNLSAFQSISRSWDLTQKVASRLLLVLFILIVITFPIIALLSFGPELIFSQILNSIERDSSLYIGLTLIFYGFNQGVGILAGSIIFPLWQVAKGVIYYDLRNRREGLGLSLPESG